MLSRQNLFWLSRPYDLPGTDQAFLRAVRDNCAYHIRHCPEYRVLARGEGFSPEQLRTMEDLQRIPALPTLYFKRHAIFSMPAWRRCFEVTSSGTSGSFSRIRFDWGCVLAEVPMLLKLARLHGLISPVPAHYVVLGYRPDRGNHTGVVRTMWGLTWFAPPLSRHYCLEKREGTYIPDLDGSVRALKKLAASRFPVRIIGFPSYLWFGLTRMEELGISLKLRSGSRIILAGGWKQHYAQEVEKPRLYALVKKILGIPEDHINELFGAVEHPIFYNTCPNHRFHIPAYARVLIRDVRTLEPLPVGETGIVNLISPLMCATPTVSVMTDDLGMLEPGEACGCGIASPTLTILGRVGLSGITTCAAGAAQLLGKEESL